MTEYDLCPRLRSDCPRRGLLNWVREFSKRSSFLQWNYTISIKSSGTLCTLVAGVTQRKRRRHNGEESEIEILHSPRSGPCPPQYENSRSQILDIVAPRSFRTAEEIVEETQRQRPFLVILIDGTSDFNNKLNSVIRVKSPSRY